MTDFNITIPVESFDGIILWESIGTMTNNDEKWIVGRSISSTCLFIRKKDSPISYRVKTEDIMVEILKTLIKE